MITFGKSFDKAMTNLQLMIETVKCWFEIKTKEMQSICKISFFLQTMDLLQIPKKIKLYRKGVYLLIKQRWEGF